MTVIATGTEALDSHLRAVVRDSSENIIAVVPTSTTAVTPYISSDGGDTWTAGDTTISSDSGPGAHIAIDSTDTIHVASRDPGSSGAIIYNQFTIGTGGAVTMNVTDETIASSGGYTQPSCAITVDSTDVPWALVSQKNTVMGTKYDAVTLADRSGGSWTLTDIDTSQTNNTRYTIAVDSADDVHMAWEDIDNLNADYAKYDVSAGSVSIGPEIIVSSTYSGNIIINSNDEPLVTMSDDVWLRSGGSWSSDRYTDDSVNQSSLTFQGGDILIFYAESSNNNIKYNKATFGNFDTTAETLLDDTSNFSTPLSRWQFNNLNDPASGEADVIYYDNTNSETEWNSVGGTTSVSETAALATSGNPTTPSEVGGATEVPTLVTDGGVAATVPNAVGDPVAGALTTAAGFSATETGSASDSGALTTSSGVSASEVASVAEAAAVLGSAALSTSETGSAADTASLLASVLLSATVSNAVGKPVTAALVASSSVSASETAFASDSGSILVAAVVSATSSEGGTAVSEVASLTASAIADATVPNAVGDPVTATLPTGTGVEASVPNAIGTPASVSLATVASVETTEVANVVEAATLSTSSALSATETAGVGEDASVSVTTFLASSVPSAVGTPATGGLNIVFDGSTAESASASDSATATISAAVGASSTSKTSVGETATLTINTSVATAETIALVFDEIPLESIRSLTFQADSRHDLEQALDSIRNIIEELKSET